MKRKHKLLKHPAVCSLARLACAAGCAVALFGTSIPFMPVPEGNGRLPVLTGSEIPWQGGADEAGDGQGISTQNDDKTAGTLST